RNLKLLAHDLFNAGGVSLFDHRPRLGPKHRFRFGFIEQRSKLGDGLHQLDSVFLSGKALVHFQKWHDTLDVPEIIRRRLPLDVPVHRVLEQDGPNNPLPVEAGAGDDASPHLMHNHKHPLLVGPGTFFDPVKTQRLGCAATALIQCRDEARVRFYFLQLLFVDSERFHNASFSSRYCLIRLLAELPSANLLTESSRRLVSRIIVKSSRVAMTRIRPGEASAATSASTTAHCSRDRQLHRRRMLQSPPRPKARSTPL